MHSDFLICCDILFFTYLLFQCVDGVAKQQSLFFVIEDDLAEQFATVLVGTSIAVASFLQIAFDGGLALTSFKQFIIEVSSLRRTEVLSAGVGCVIVDDEGGIRFGYLLAGVGGASRTDGLEPGKGCLTFFPVPQVSAMLLMSASSRICCSVYIDGSYERRVSGRMNIYMHTLPSG